MPTIDEYVSVTTDHQDITIEGTEEELDVIHIIDDQFHRLLISPEDEYIYVAEECRYSRDYVISRKMAEMFLKPCRQCWPEERMSPIEGMRIEEPKPREPIDIVVP